MSEVNEGDIAECIDDLVSSFNREYQEMEKADLETRWFFQFDPKKSARWNLYKFYDCLKMYQHACRKWEEIHNGSVCVVERVRDEYLIPKIDQFAVDFQNHLTTEETSE